MKNSRVILISIGLLHFLFSQNTYAQWIDQQYLPDALSQIFFTTSQNGFILGENTLFATSDGGLNWITRSSPPLPLEIFFLNAELGWSAGYFLCKTTNGGISWYPTNAPFNSHSYHSVFFINSLTGWVVANGGAIMKTTDGGENWESQPSGTTENFFSVFFVNPRNGWAVGGTTKRTIDGGNTWEDFGISSGFMCKKVLFTDPRHGFILADQNLIVSSDSGYTWIVKPRIEGSSFFNCVAFKDSITGWIGGYGGEGIPSSEIFKTTDAGSTWQLQFNRTNGQMYSICFIDSISVWAVGSNAFLKTSIGGLNSINGEFVPLISTRFVLDQNYPNPFNPTTTISFNLPLKSLVSVKIFDIIGREVVTLVNEELFAGNHIRQWNANDFPSGVYYYRLQTGSFSETKKLILIK